MKSTTKYYLILFTTVAVYLGASKLVFDKVYETLDVVIDELFHIPQGIAYCEKNFTYWNEKITTLPGLYIVSTAFLNDLFDCNTYNLRFVNLLASCMNLMLFASLLKYVYFTSSHFSTVWQALNLTLLPPLYFFSHVYYTDTLSLTFLLAFSRLSLGNGKNFLILFFGLASVLMRQTNIVWVAMVFGHKLMNLLIVSSRVFGNQFLSKTKLSSQSMIAKDIDTSKLKRYYSIGDFFVASMYHITTCGATFFKFLTFDDVSMLLTHGSLLISFIAFVIWNGSIVVGDKQAHQAALHIPQIFYFLLFYGVFGLPYVINRFFSTLRLIKTNKFKIAIFTVVFLYIVHYNTIVHRYLLADNRHFTFYVWNRWYGKESANKYIIVPAYVFLLFSLYDNLRHQNSITFLLPYSVCLFFGLCMQQMIEIRYFLVPYIILRLRFGRSTWHVMLLEFVWYVGLNAAVFYVFFTKEIIWPDFDYPQRIIW